MPPSPLGIPTAPSLESPPDTTLLGPHGHGDSKLPRNGSEGTRGLLFRTDSSDTWEIPPAEQPHIRSLARKNGEQWLSLTVLSRAADADEPPVFHQGDEVSGWLALDLPREEHIDSVTLSIVGHLDIPSHSAADFFRMSQTLYSASSTTGVSSSRGGRLKGDHVFAYSMVLPKGVAVATDRQSPRKNYRLPPSFADGHSGSSVEYSLVVRIHKGNSRGTEKLVVPFQFVPLLRPSPPTILRQLAYQLNDPISGPDHDPSGWKTLAPVQIQGKLLDSVHVTAQFKLSLARPVCYTRGTPVPLALEVRCSEQQFLDLLAPETLKVQLVQRITIGDKAKSQSVTPEPGVRSLKRGTAVWWRAPAADALTGDESGRMLFAGELLVPAELVPACEILQYGHEYQVVMFPPHLVGFTSSASAQDPLFTEPVAIATVLAQAVPPRSYATPTP